MDSNFDEARGTIDVGFTRGDTSKEPIVEREWRHGSDVPINTRIRRQMRLSG